VVYVSWSETPEAWDPETEGGYPDVYYAYLENGEWSEPKNMSNTPDWGEYGAGLYAHDKDIHVFFGSSKLTEPGQMNYLVLRKGEIIRQEKANFSFLDIAMIFEDDKIHAVYGNWAYSEPYDSTKEYLALEGKVFYNYFDGQDWYAGMGAELLPPEFSENSEKPTLVASSIGPGYQDKILLENGETDLYREMHPEAVYKDGLIHAVFEHNQHGTYDAYYIVFKPKNP
jgi:hypothetical protein